MKDYIPVLIGVLIGAILVILFLGAVAGVWFVVLPALKPTTTTTTLATTSTTTSSSSTTTSTTTSSTTTSTTTTTTLAPFYVCEREVEEYRDLIINCKSRDRFNQDTSDWHNITKKSNVEMTLDDSIISSSYEDNRVKIIGDECIYVIDKCPISVGKLQTCIKPIGRIERSPARLVTP